MRRWLTILLALTFVLAGCGGAKETTTGGGTITVGSKDFTENIILGEMLAQLIEAQTDLKVERKLNLGGTMVNFEGVKSGALDLYVDYDGTAWAAHLGHTEAPPANLFEVVKAELEEQFQLTFTDPLGFNNTYALAMPRHLAEEYNIKTYSDLAAHSDQFVFGTSSEFMGREADGYYPLVETYGMNFKDVATMAVGLRYPAIEQNEIQVMDAYATDGNLIAFDMMILEDDKSFFPPYWAAPLVRLETLERHPELRGVLNLLAGTLNDEKMQQLNYQVAVEQKDEAEVAAAFLRELGLK